MKRYFVFLVAVVLAGSMFILSACGSTVPDIESWFVANDSTLSDSTADMASDVSGYS